MVTFTRLWCRIAQSNREMWLMACLWPGGPGAWLWFLSAGFVHFCKQHQLPRMSCCRSSKRTVHVRPLASVGPLAPGDVVLVGEPHRAHRASVSRASRFSPVWVRSCGTTWLLSLKRLGNSRAAGSKWIECSTIAWVRLGLPHLPVGGTYRTWEAPQINATRSMQMVSQYHLGAGQ